MTETSYHTITGIKPKIVKGNDIKNVSENMDANLMAQLEIERVKEHDQIKKDKIESFMNNTRINASKLYKEQCNKNLKEMNSKKELLDKQKELKAKYTIVPKKNDKIIEMEKQIKLPKEPFQVNWKQAEDVIGKIHIPVENCEVNDSSGDESAYDSEIDLEKNETPDQVNKVRANIRKTMMEKFKRC